MVNKKHRRCEGVARSNPVSKIPIVLLIAWLMPSAAGAGLYETLTQKLAQYCVPKDDGGCSASARAKYCSGTCKCGNASLAYDASERRCVFKCPAGNVPRTMASCPAGSGRVEIPVNEPC